MLLKQIKKIMENEICQYHIDPQPPTTYVVKKNMVVTLLKNVDTKAKKHYQKYRSYRTYNTRINLLISTLNAMSVCSLVVNLSPDMPWLRISALVTTSVSALSSAGLVTFELSHKIHSHQTSYLQYTDLLRDIQARLEINGLSSKDLDSMLMQMNSRLGLIEDQSLPLSNIFEEREIRTQV